MSGDYKVSIEEGATMVRIGSSIFGEGSIEMISYYYCLNNNINNSYNDLQRRKPSE
jgi:hypothetical protein